MAGAPLPPPRGRLPSNPGTSEGALWHAIGAIQSDVSGLKNGVADLKDDHAEFKLAHADLKAALAGQNAGTKNQTIQLIVASVTSVVLAVAGSRVTAPKPEPTTTVIQRSAFDRALDACRELSSPETQAVCIARLLRESVANSR